VVAGRAVMAADNRVLELGAIFSLEVRCEPDVVKERGSTKVERPSGCRNPLGGLSGGNLEKLSGQLINKSHDYYSKLTVVFGRNRRSLLD